MRRASPLLRSPVILLVLAPMGAILGGCAEPRPSGAEGGGPAEPPENRAPIVSLSGASTLGEGETRNLGPVFDPDGDPLAIAIRDVTPGLSVEVVNGELEVSVGYGLAAGDEEAVARATIDLDDGRGGRLVEELVVRVAPLAWSERARWMAANGPRPRVGAVHLVAEGAIYVLFGEEDGEPADEAWRFDREDSTWSPVALIGDVPVPGAGKRAVTAGAAGTLLHGGLGPDGAPVDDLHRVTVESATVLAFERLEQEGAPPPRAEHVFVAGPAALGDEPATPAAVVFGGRGGTSDAPEALADLWTLDLVDGRARWSLATPEVVPPARLAIAVASDVEGGRAVLFGGRAAPSEPPVGGTWALDVSADGGPRFEEVEAGGAPAPRAGASAAWDPVGHRAFLVGGVDADGVARDEVFVLDERGDAAEWIAIARSGAPPVGEGSVVLSWASGWGPDGGAPRTALWVGLGSEPALHLLAPRPGDGYGRGW